MATTARIAERDGVLAAKAQTARLMAKLWRGVEDAAVLFVSDSTMATNLRPAYVWAQRIAAQFPAYTVVFHMWGEATNAPTGGGTPAYDTGDAPAATTIQTGTGTVTLHVWCFAASGQQTYFGLGSRWPVAVQAISPDWICVNHGKNEGIVASTSVAVVRGQMLGLTESLTAEHPHAGLSIILQCPTVDTTTRQPTADMATKARIYEEIAGQRGYGVINVHDAFLSTGNPGAFLRADGVHETDSSDTQSTSPLGNNGVEIWVNQMLAHCQHEVLGGGPRQQEPSALTTYSAQLLSNGTFSAWSGAGPDGWTLVNAVASKDTRSGYYESENGYSLRLQASSAAQSYAYQNLTNYKALRGCWVTVLGRRRISTGTFTSGQGPGRLAIQDGVTTVTMPSMGTALDGFMWVTTSIKVATTASFLRVTAYADSAANGAADVNWDRIYVVLGKLPRIGNQGAVGPVGPAGPASLTTVDHLSTLGTNPLLTLLGSGSVIQNSVNQAILTPFKPARDISLALLEWACAVSSGNYDIGIYDASGTRLWSKGSTVFPTAGTSQVETVSPAVALTAGTTYYLAFAADNVTGSPRGIVGSNASFGSFLKMLNGTYYTRIVSSAFPLPATLTLGTVVSYKVPAVVMRET